MGRGCLALLQLCLSSSSVIRRREQGKQCQSLQKRPAQVGYIQGTLTPVCDALQGSYYARLVGLIYIPALRALLSTFFGIINCTVATLS